MELIISILIVYGMSAIVTQSKIFEPVRKYAADHSPNFWKYLTSCMQCFPFWGGIFVSLLMGAPFTVENEQLHPVLNAFFTYLFAGSLFSATSMFINTLHLYFKNGINGTASPKPEAQPEDEKEIFPKGAHYTING